jgi:hypothetical protein
MGLVTVIPPLDGLINAIFAGIVCNAGRNPHVL